LKPIASASVQVCWVAENRVFEVLEGQPC